MKYLEVNGVNQHQGSELVNGALGDDVFDAAFSLISYPAVDGHSGLLRILLRKTGNNSTHLFDSLALTFKLSLIPI